MRRYLAEFIGTFILVFCGCGAIVTNTISGGAVTHPGIALVFGLVVMSVIYALGETSGAHINPAATFTFAITGRFKWSQTPFYIAAQCAGALAACLVLKLLFPEHPTLGATLPAGSATQSFVLEVVLTAMLMFVVLCVATGSKEQGLMAGIAIGGVVGLEAMFAGPISGASMNPARSLGPAIVSGRIAELWIYLLAPLLGAAVGAGAWKLTCTARPCE